MDGGAWWAADHGVAKSRTRLSNFPFTFHFHALEKEVATHSSVLAWRIPGTGQPGGLPSMGSHRVRHNWSDLAAAAEPIASVARVMLKTTASYAELNSLSRLHLCIYFPKSSLFFLLDAPVSFFPLGFLQAQAEALGPCVGSWLFLKIDFIYDVWQMVCLFFLGPNSCLFSRECADLLPWPTC